MPDVFGQIPELIENDVRIGKDRSRQDAGLQRGRLVQDYSQQVLPQLQSGIASRGQFYSSARRKAEAFSHQDVTRGIEDINMAMQRQLDDFDRRRLYASIGLIV